jgi:hypothetical protein
LGHDLRFSVPHYPPRPKEKSGFPYTLYFV